MHAVMIVPTGIGCEIGGHSGDATSASHLLAAACDQLLLHPNVVNASDLISIPENALYVEGSVLDDVLAGETFLRPVLRNEILVACNEAKPITVNAVNAARSIYGVEASIVELATPLEMYGTIGADQASGTYIGAEELILRVRDIQFDALAVHTPITVERSVEDHYLAEGGINPWGGVEAKLSRRLTSELKVPVAYAPVEVRPLEEAAEADPRLAPEMICGSHLVSVLVGLSRAPQFRSNGMIGDVGRDGIGAMVSPVCWGRPHELCRKAGIPIVFVRENWTAQWKRFHERPDTSRDLVVENYLEAAGALLAMGIGRTVESMVRPLIPALIVR